MFCMNRLIFFVLISCPLLYMLDALHRQHVEFMIWLSSGSLGRENHLWMIPRATSHLMQGYVARFCWPRFWARASPRLPCIFPPIYISRPSPYFSISTLLTFQERTRRPYFWLIRQLLSTPSFPRPFYSFKTYLPVSSSSLFLCTFILPEQFLIKDVSLGT